MDVEVSPRQRIVRNAPPILLLVSFVLMVASIVVGPDKTVRGTVLHLQWLAVAFFFAGLIAMVVASTFQAEMRRAFGPFMSRGFWVVLIATGFIVGLIEACKRA